MSEIDAYATEFVEVFGLSFPCPELYTLANSSSDTITPACYAVQHLTPAVAGRRLKDPFAHRRHVAFTVHDDPIQEYFDDSKHWAHTTLIIPGGINIEWAGLIHVSIIIFLSFSRLVTLRFTKYNFDDVPGGHTLGFHLSHLRATNRKFTVVSTHTPGQRKTYKTHAEATAHIYSLALPADFSGYLEDNRPSWLLYLSPRTLEKNVRVGDLVRVDHSGFYTGGVVLELAPTRCEDAGLRRVLVKGAWKDCEVTKGDGAFFYLLVTPDRCAVTARAIPARWIIDEHPHDQVDITFCGTTIITNLSMLLQERPIGP
jgi:hypothetical protein